MKADNFSEQNVLELTLKEDWDYPPNPDTPQGHFIGRVDEYDRLINDILRKNSGSILLSGSRGVGKTSLVYKVLQEVKPLVKNGNRTLLPVILNASQLKVDSDSELNRNVITGLIRRLYSASVMTQENGKDNDKKYVKVSKLYIKAVSKTAEITERVEDITSEEVVESRVRSSQIHVKPNLKTIIATIFAVAAALFFVNGNIPKPYSEIVAFIVLLSGYFAVTFSLERTERSETNKKQAREASEIYIRDNDIGNLEFDLERVLESLNESHKVVFVIDELDKISKPELVIQVIKAFKNLFTLTPAIFIFITGDDVFERIEESLTDREIEATLFTHRVFLTRPGFKDLEKFMLDIIKDSAKKGELTEEPMFRQFLNLACFEARSDFTRLYEKIRDYITGFEAMRFPIIGISELTSDETNKAGMQKAVGLVFDYYRSSEPSKWSSNEQLLGQLYKCAEDLLDKDPGADVVEPFGDEAYKEVKIELVHLLARYGALHSKGKVPVEDGDQKHEAEGYTWSGKIGEIPKSIETLTSVEQRYLQAWEAFTSFSFKVINLKRKVTKAVLISKNNIEKNKEEVINELLYLAGMNPQPLFDASAPILRGLKYLPPEHYPREELGKSVNELKQFVEQLKSKFYEIVLRIFKNEIFDAGPLQQRGELFSALLDLRSSVINNSVTHQVISKKDLSKQLLLVSDISPEVIWQNRKLIKQNRETFKIVNIQKDEKLHYKQHSYLNKGFYNISGWDQFSLVPTLKKVMNWLLIET